MKAVCLLMAITLAVGCSVPAGDSLDDFADKIANMSPMSRKAAQLAEARARTLNALLDHGPDEHAGDLECKDDIGGIVQRVPVKQIVACITAAPSATWATCVATMVADFKREQTKSGPMTSSAWCRFKPSSDLQVDVKWDPDQITDDDLARTAFASREGPPAWMIAAGIVAIGAGGVFIFASGWAVVLCPLDLGYGCPGDPLTPGETPGSSSSGGDR